MNIAIIHYHLRSGGVSSVLRSQADALRRHAPWHRVVVLSGSEAAEAFPAPIKLVRNLDYALVATGSAAPSAEGLAAAMEHALDEAFPDGCDVLHVHNPLIRKNAVFLGALGLLKSRGRHLLVQVHDLAEDFRPDVFDAAVPYPENCSYAAINSRDRSHLIASGLGDSHVHLLPNPVGLPERFDVRAGWSEESRRGRTIALYPVRAIRRKNLGEALLLSRFLPEGAELAVTLPPTSERDLPGYRSWKSMASRLAPRLRFEAGLHASLGELYEKAFCVVTTSVKEGFGFSFLDPIARGIPVVGREIPYVVGDFRAHGIRLPNLYHEIRLPRLALPEAELRTAVARRIDSFRKAYATAWTDGGSPAGPTLDEVLARLEARFEAEYLDFGSLDESLQQAVLRRLDVDAALEADLRALNPFLDALFIPGLPESEAAEGREALARFYSAEAYARSLDGAYTDAMSDGAKGRIDRRALLERCLVAPSFFLSAS